MGVALDRYLPGRNTMLATKPMYYKERLTNSKSSAKG